MRGRAVVARRAHNPEVIGSNPVPATKTKGETQVFLPLFFPQYSCSNSNCAKTSSEASRVPKAQTH